MGLVTSRFFLFVLSLVSLIMNFGVAGHCRSSSHWTFFYPFLIFVHAIRYMNVSLSTWASTSGNTKHYTRYVSRDHPSTATVASYATGPAAQHMTRHTDCSNPYIATHRTPGTTTKQLTDTKAQTKLTSHWASEQTPICVPYGALASVHLERT